MSRFLHIFSACFIVAFLLIIASCGTPAANLYTTGDDDRDEEIGELLILLERRDLKPEIRFPLVEEISRFLNSAGELEKENLFLTSFIKEYPDDPYCGYYLYLVAENYRKRKAASFARIYYSRILHNYNDLIVDGTSIHYQCLQQLVTLSEKPELQVEYYNQLLTRFGENIDSGKTYYYLAKTYENIGEWDKAYQAYEQFLRYPDTTIPGFPNVYKKISQKVAFHKSNKSWAVESLDELVKKIKWALYRRNSRELLKYRATSHYFFSSSWEQEDDDVNSRMFFNVGEFLGRYPVHYSRDIDIASNSREAYLKTWGWYYWLSTWYLYFRKIDYPADPEINGRWEWVGIYFGEKL
ncbi:MAG: tetratricopeptide repeat protein [Spirochaetia bacterium]